LEFEEEYRMKLFEPYFPHRVCTTTKFTIDTKYRNTTVASRLTNKLYESAASNHIFFDFINGSDYNNRIYRRLGYRRYADIYPEWGKAIPMDLPLNDERHLHAVNALVANLAPKDPLKQQGVDDFLRSGVERPV
jgi:ribosomal protein S18 acetylase RimI-like enzyme